MTRAAEETKISAEDFLAGEEASPVRHEDLAGDLFAMAEAALDRGT